MKLTPSFSAYLDFLRFTAAFIVLLGHMVQDGFALGWVPIAYLSHEAVIVFFVMSGYIVYASTVARGGTARDYIVARVSRIYSVALPAVVFCVLLSLWFAWHYPALATEQPSWRPFSVLDVALSLLFLNESWGTTTQLTLNGPYWSLCYEVWYYVLFGVYFFVRGPWRWPAVGLAALIAGPAILVLFPIWVLGAYLAKRPPRTSRWRQSTALLAWAGSIALVWLISDMDLDQLIKSWLHNRVPGFWRLEASQRMFTDYLVALALVAHLSAYQDLPASVRGFFERGRATWAALAGFSFTLYLFHRPFTALAGDLIPASAQTVPLALLSLGLVLAVCWGISFVTERRLPAWRRVIRRWIGGDRRPGPRDVSTGAATH